MQKYESYTLLRQTSNIVRSKQIMKSIVRRNKTDKWLEIFLAEVAGTTLLMYFGCMGLFGSLGGVVPLAPLQGGISFGFVVSSIIVAIGHISNAHLNPSVTLCSYLLGMITPITATIYFIAECIGCMLGLWLLKLSAPGDLFNEYATANSSCGFCTTVLHPKVGISQGFLVEFLATSFLIYVVCSVWDPRNAKNSDSTPIKFGLLITVLSIVAGPFTGASLNPARSLAPAVINNIWTHHWIYWLAPLSGSVLTTMFYKCCFLNIEPPTEDMVDTALKLTHSPNDENKAINEKGQNLV